MKIIVTLLVASTIMLGCSHMNPVIEKYVKPNPRPWTTEEKQAAVYFTIGHWMDAWSTHKFLKNPDLYEMNPIMGKHPNDGEIFLYSGATEIMALGICHWWPWLRKPLLFGYGTTGIYWYRHNKRLEAK